ncbi:DeoR family transcriptional regulator, fructose operon transcriptional repressor [Propionibacterium cyclohexanicum]|uniref:Lactose phosphotransferase system repressor n=1 Tax=Propionibacterium cyclohexanicum TaxID=64702 RepID=A0A1H9TS03_9ACTN|nr:DeoR/GlpR family DNA-binding transcription regulator [Propionibacterium cyclohexanicum]SER99777.1 DeoR family transcriptional regulator, fructose operon transcriptional repressor [Propionibacterium cyclohexanicum]
MYQPERQKRLLDIARQEGRVSVAAASSQFRVVPETIRRDLDQMAAKGLLRRVHGGAIPADFDELGDTSVDARDLSAVEEKEAIAQAALAYLPAPGGTIILDAGTTTRRLASKFLEGSRYTVFTDSAPIAALLAARTACDVRLIGGRLRGTTQATVGNVAEFAQLRVDVSFMGTNGLSLSHGLSTPDVDEAATKAAMIAAARHVVVLTDSRKIGAESTKRFATLDDIDVLITDEGIPQHQLAELTKAGVEVVRA